MLVQRRRDGRAALRLMRKLLKKHEHTSELGIVVQGAPPTMPMGERRA
jgi:hypothetical protein